MCFLKGYKKTDAVGTALSCYLHASYAELLLVFGKPHILNSVHANSLASWTFQHKKMYIVIDIYDYVLDENRTLETITIWSIGTQNNGECERNTLNELHRLFPTKLITNYKNEVIFLAVE